MISHSHISYIEQRVYNFGKNSLVSVASILTGPGIYGFGQPTCQGLPLLHMTLQIDMYMSSEITSPDNTIVIQI